MSLIVQKFGGTSVGSPDLIRRLATRVIGERADGNAVVVVVSAMGQMTDDLLRLAGAISQDPVRSHPRELDMLLTAGERISMALLAMAIREAGIEAISFTGSQAAIITDGAHTGAKIQEVKAGRVAEELRRGRVAIVAGFQGVSRLREVTTLGRGGSDTTAVALGVALGAERCDIYTDVDGVYTADPRRVQSARRIERVSYEEMLELAQCGAQVVHPRAVQIAARHDLPIRVLSSFEEKAVGTLIVPKDRGMEDLLVTGVASDCCHARLLLGGLPRGMEATAAVLGRLATAGVSVDMVAQADRSDGRRQLQLTVREDSLPEASAVCEALLDEVGGDRLEVRSGLARLALVGHGMHGQPGVYASAFQALLEAGVEVHALSTSSISVSLLVEAAQQSLAIDALHRTFGLAEEAA